MMYSAKNFGAINHILIYWADRNTIFQNGPNTLLKKFGKNGNWITILSRAMAMRNNEGELTGMVIGTHLDITNIQETAENLISTQKNLKKVKNFKHIASGFRPIFGVHSYRGV